MLQSWHNFLFASFDPGGLVSVDKPPLALWVEAASAKALRVLGLRDPPARGARGCRRRRAPLPGGRTPVRSRRRARRGACARGLARLGCRQPRQQPRRSLRAPPRRIRVRRDASRRVRAAGDPPRRRRARRPCLQHEDARCGAGRPGSDPCLCRLREAADASTALAARGRRRGARRRLGCVDRRGRADAGGRSSLRRQHRRQQCPQPCIRLQRHRAGDRSRGWNVHRRPRRRWTRRCVLRNARRASAC